MVIAPYTCSDDSENLPSLMAHGHDLKIPSRSYYETRELPSDFRSLPMKESFSSQSFTMYPLMLQSPFYANVPPQILNTLTPNRNQGSVSPNNNVPSSYSVLSPLYCAPPSPALTAQNSYSPSRAVPGFLRPDGRRQNATRVSKVASNGAANHHNHVDVSRIRDGIDVRTTVSGRQTVYKRSDRLNALLTNAQCRSCCETSPTKSIRSC